MRAKVGHTMSFVAIETRKTLVEKFPLWNAAFCCEYFDDSNKQKGTVVVGVVVAMA